MGERLASISYFTAINETAMNAWTVAKEYDPSGRLVAEWNPQAGTLKETYSYTAGGQLATITPPGLEPWKMEYGTIAGEAADGRLLAVKRASLLASPTEAQWTVAYGVPVSGSGAPYEMSRAEVSRWGEKDLPTDATAVFPPSEVPASPPSAYKQATVYYMDPEGQLANTASAAGAGTSAPSITTTETEEFGNVVRELSANNRIAALAAGAGSVARSEELDTERAYSPDGTQLEEERGPAHQVRLQSGASVQARSYKLIKYEDPAPPTGYPPYHLPTKETSGALHGGEVLEAHLSETKYDWTLRAPEETVVDPAGLDIRSVTKYNDTTGLPVESRQPSNPGGGGAGTTKTLYYAATPGTPGPGCQNLQFAGLPCEVLPAAQASGSGRPELLARRFTSYNLLGEPTEIRESPGGKEEIVKQTVATTTAPGASSRRRSWGAGRRPPRPSPTTARRPGCPSTSTSSANRAAASSTPRKPGPAMTRSVGQRNTKTPTATSRKRPTTSTAAR